MSVRGGLAHGLHWELGRISFQRYAVRYLKWDFSRRGLEDGCDAEAENHQIYRRGF